MSEEQDGQVQQAAQQALDEIARLHEHAVTAVWEQYPAPVPRKSRGGGDSSGQQESQGRQAAPGQHSSPQAGTASGE